MTETQTEYTVPADLPAIEARLAAFGTENEEVVIDFYANAPADLRALLAEVKRLRLQVTQLAEALEAWTQ